MPAALVETGFMSNPSDEAKLATDKYRRQIAESMLKGIIKYLEKQNSRVWGYFICLAKIR